MTSNKPAAEVVINHDLIHMLLSDFVPDIAELPVSLHAAGWDNEIHRIGDEHAIRLPRREVAAPLIVNEQLWMAELAESLPLPIPTPIFSGKPAFGFPFHWSVVPWLPGVTLLHAPPLDPNHLMEQLSGFMNALHIAAPSDAPKNPFRGVPLADRADGVVKHLAMCAPTLASLEIDAETVRAAWDSLVDAPEFGGEPAWVHGDLHLANILVRGGQLSGVIDFGDMCSGDPAVDLSVAWMLFDDGSDRLAFRKMLTIDGRSIDVHTWKRARGNALAHALAVLANSDDEPGLRRMGVRTLRNALLGG